MDEKGGLEAARLFKREIKKGFADLLYFRESFGWRQSVHARGPLRQPVQHKSVHERFLAIKVTVDRHRRDADSLRHAAQGQLLEALFVEELARRTKNTRSRLHVYSVY